MSASARPVVAFVVNGAPGSAMDVRARALAERLGEYDVRVVYRGDKKIRALARIFVTLVAMRPDVAWVFDIAYSGVIATWLASIFTWSPWVIDTGDPIVELARALGRGRVGMALTRLLERIALGRAAHVVVRGTFHERWLREHGHSRVTTIQDGVDVAQFEAVKAAPREGDELVLGLVGTLSGLYGLDAIEALGALRDSPVKALVVGDGPGASRLRERARELGVEARVELAGRVPYEHLPGLLARMDIAISTQSDDLVGRFRTTGKLPLYLAAGKFILASDVGEAQLVLPPEMRFGFEPGALVAKIRAVLADRSRLRLGHDGPCIAREKFDYSVLAARAATVLASLR